MLLNTNMVLKTLDLQLRLSAEFSTTQACLNYKDELVPAIEILLDDTDPKNGLKKKINEAFFYMSIEDAKVLHSWLGTVLNNK
jgi:hypothetical protein